MNASTENHLYTWKYLSMFYVRRNKYYVLMLLKVLKIVRNMKLKPKSSENCQQADFVSLVLTFC